MSRNYSRGKGYEFPPIAIPYSPAETHMTRFPRAFTRYLDGKLPKQIHLRDWYGNDWTVITGEFDNQTYILEGWRKFIVENFVKPGDVIVFRYNGDISFDVKIFGLDGCETEGAGRGLIRSDEEESEFDDHEYSIEEYTHEKEFVQHIPPKKRKPMDSLRPDLFKSGRFERPNNPYFVTRIRKRRRNELHVPFDTILLFKLKLPRVIVLRDSAGRKWEAGHRRWGDGRQLYVGGWRELCAANLVTEQDLCICEFARRRNGDICLQIDFARGLA